MFKIGDTVEITDEAAATGMLDFLKGKGYEVELYAGCMVNIVNESGKRGWYSRDHFKLKENTEADAVSEFGVGDTVEIVESSYDTGMMDFVLGKGYEVHDFRIADNGRFTAQVLVKDESGYFMWCHPGHFKLHTKKEEKKVEKKECLFKVGQTVWDVRVGKGKVWKFYEAEDLPAAIEVEFDNGENDLYTLDGKLLETDEYRSLYFSEPKIEAATEPGFEPVLEAGMTLAAINKQSSCFYMIVVSEETEEVVKSVHRLVFEKEKYDFYRLGEKINFK